MARLSPAVAVHDGAYAAIGPNLRRELGVYATSKVQPPPFLAEALARWEQGATVAVPDWLLPDDLRPADKRTRTTVTVAPDGYMESELSAGREILEWLGV
ncbi:hypothetical protein BHQ15_17840 [Mycolicibacillus koreensis]|nr:hypothetical protein BHQ15_17840 [Mycolicibacillus koreensis]